jgi:iron complex transport system substrate-binding protein
MPGCQGVKVEAGVSPALCRNCKSQDKPGNLPRFAPQSTFSELGGGLDDTITNITQPITELGYFFSEVIMKKTIPILCVLLLLVVSACQTAPTALPQPTTTLASSGAIASPEANSQLPITIRYAKGFTLEYKNNYKILTVTQPWADAEQAFTYVLIPRGAEIPAEVGNALMIEVPVRSFVAMSTTYYPFLENIGKLDALVAVDDATYIYNPSVREKAASGKIAVVGGGMGGPSANVERLLELNPDVIMTSASGIPELDVYPKLQEVGLPVVINGDYLEQTPLGRAEWGIFIAAFFGLEQQASQQFDALVQRYEEVSALAANVQERVTVLTNTDYQGTWYVPAGESYAAILLKDAGAEYLWEDEPGSGALPLSFETVFERAKDADFWLNPGFAASLQDLLAMDARYAEFKAFQTGNVFNYNARVSEAGGMDYFESGVANPDVILKDLIKIFYPELLPEHTLFYYQQLK